jgi:predicted transposase YdaD
VAVDGIRNEIIFHRILLWEFEDKIRSDELRELAPLLILFSKQKDRQVIDEERNLISQIIDRQEQADLLALSAMVAYRRFKDILIKELFYKEYNMLKQSSFVREWIDEGKKEGFREGRIELLLAQLKRILGRVNSDLEERINKLNDKELDKLSLDLLGIKQLSDLEEWFRLHQKK